MAGAFRQILPGSVAVQAKERLGANVALYPSEAAAAAVMAPSRRAEFATGRACARQALADLGLPPVDIPVGADREPQWPPIVVGSITHWDEVGVAAVARSIAWHAIGIDGERDGSLPSETLDLVATEAEMERLRANGPEWATRLFVMKEAAFKAWFPTTRRRLAFDQLVITIDAGGQTFHAHFVAQAVPPLFAGGVHGRFMAQGSSFLAAVCVPRQPSTR